MIKVKKWLHNKRKEEAASAEKVVFISSTPAQLANRTEA
jgi:hypothetical protein